MIKPAWPRKPSTELHRVCARSQFDRYPLLRYGCFGRVILDELANLLILDQQLRELFLARVPSALPGHHDAGSEPNWIYLLSISFLQLFESLEFYGNVTGSLKIVKAWPRDRG